MFIAQQKRKENIAEYILYLWQIEDLIRAYSLNIENVVANVISRTGYSEDEKKQLVEWYESLVEMMRQEGVEQKGHLQMIKNTLSDVVELHYALLKTPKYPEYSALFYQVLPTIGILRQRQQNPDIDDVEVCFVFLYGVLLLRLQKKELSSDTEMAVKQIGKFLSMLSQKYKLYQQDELELTELEI